MNSALSESRRIIAIGDVHGCISSLKKLIALINLEPDDQLVFLGDMIDRGDHSKEVIDYLINLKTLYSCHFIMGNHEVMFLDYLEKRNSATWLETGGQETLNSYNYNTINGPEFPENHLDFIRSCQYFIETENYVFTHGGLDPELSIKDNLRYYQPEDFCWQRMHMLPRFLEHKKYRWEKTVVCAHTPVSDPVMIKQLIAIDTGCVYKENPLFGKLTAVILPERVIVQSENKD